MTSRIVVNRTCVRRLVWALNALILSMASPLALARCDDVQRNNASQIAEEASRTVDVVDRVIMLRRSLKVCPEFAVWLELGKTELALENPIDAAYALENARDFYVADEDNAYSSSQVLRRAIANSWLAETYQRDDALALAIVATQEATAGYESLGQRVPDRLIELQAEIDDALASADSTVLARSLSLQHNRASRGIGVQSRIRVQNETDESSLETAQLLAEYSGDTTAVTPPAATSIAAVAASPPEASSDAPPVPVPATTESRLNIPVLFEFDSDQLSATSVRTVAQLGAAIQALNLVNTDSVLIIGHTDAQGGEAYNLALSQRRAQAVLRQITQITDINAELVASGQGEADLRYQGNSQDDHRRNRRVEMVIRR